MSAKQRALQLTKPTRQHHWKKRYWLVPVCVLLVLAGGQVVWQLCYPDHVAVPYASLAGRSVGGVSKVKLAADLQKKFQQSSVRLTTSSTETTQLLSVAGASVDVDSQVQGLIDYPLTQRLIPLSVFWQRPVVDEYKVVFASEQLGASAKKLAALLSTPPKDASLAIKNNQLVVTAAKDGQKVTVDSVTAALTGARFHLGETKVTVPSSKQAPTVSDSAVEPIKHKAETIITRSYQLLAPNGVKIIPDKKAIISWLVVKREGDHYLLSINQSALKAYASGLTAKMGKQPTPTRVVLVDGAVSTRQKGKLGQAVNAEDLARKLTNAIESGEPSVALDVLLVSVPSPEVYERRYSSSQAGLSAYVQYTTSTQNIRIAVKQLGGKGWTAGGRAYESTVSASTYKLYVALWLFDQMNKGKIHWGDPWLDTTVSGCFDRMTIASTNPCAEAWIKQAGRDKLNAFIWGQGFSRGTTFTNPTANHTTAGDLMNYMTRLEQGSLMSASQRDRLLHSLSVHPYRSGVPAGAGGTVYDKVGFLWDYVHDAAIVRHPKGTYVIVVMTKGYSYAKIAEITRDIERIMYP